MHENKFEKQVREKMDQLGFDPADTVWAQVDREINRERKRRRPIFWIFFLSGLMLAGGAAYIGLNHSTQGKKTADVLDKTENNVQHPVQEEKTDPPAKTDHKETGNKSGTVQPGKPLVAKAVTRIETKKIMRPSHNGSNDKKDTGEQSENKKQTGGGSGEAVENEQHDEISKTPPTQTDKLTKATGIDSVVGSKTDLTKKKETKKSPWSVGFVGGAGFSNINQSLFTSQNQAGLSYSAYYPANSVSSPAAPINMPSETSGGFSFSAGVLVKRNLSKRVFGSAGLVYHYYSTGMHTGTAVDSTRTVYSGYAQTASVNSYYLNGDGKKYTNQYHFIELPVNLGFQINKSLKNPIDWEAGISLAWLVSSNALQFDPYTNVYFENDQLFNRLQWNAVTDLMFGFPVHGHTMQVGPQFQYAITSLLKNNSSFPGHLTYFGIQCRFTR